ncbi:MAG: hypothetical protein A3J99_00510 [Sideroxydans sp. RIFOXYD2_FULL_59_7]|nr:MAG: hypothetical protein A3J99_00510 [Sideroxydans sp. RIFOXYD2_FULL_59_7]
MKVNKNNTYYSSSMLPRSNTKAFTAQSINAPSIRFRVLHAHLSPQCEKLNALRHDQTSMLTENHVL